MFDNAKFDRTYISKYINLKLDNPPTPEILRKIANSSKGLTTYTELMLICGYLETDDSISYLNSFDRIRNLENLRLIENMYIARIPVKDLTIPDINSSLLSISSYSNSVIDKVHSMIKRAMDKATIIKILINIDILIYYKIIVSNKVSNKKELVNTSSLCLDNIQ